MFTIDLKSFKRKKKNLWAFYFIENKPKTIQNLFRSIIAIKKMGGEGIYIYIYIYIYMCVCVCVCVGGGKYTIQRGGLLECSDVVL